MNKLDAMLSSPNRLMYLFNVIWIVLLIWSIHTHYLLGILINGLLLFVFNYPWIKEKYLYMVDRIRTFIGRRREKVRVIIAKRQVEDTTPNYEDFDGDLD